MKPLYVLLGTFCLLSFITTTCHSQKQEGAGLTLYKQMLAKVRERNAEEAGDAIQNPQEETEELYIVLKPGVDPQEFANANGLVLLKSSPALTGRNSHVFAAPNAEGARTKLPVLSTRNSVDEVCLNKKVGAVLFDEPTDPYFAFNNHGGQWTLVDNILTPGIGIDSDLIGAWGQGYSGNNVVIGVLDDAVETAHPDLIQQHMPSLSYDYAADDMDPSPVFFNENHGTPVTGIFAAKGGNGVGVTGAAPGSKFAAYRVSFTANDSTQQFADGIVHGGSSIDVKNHSWGYTQSFFSESAITNAFFAANDQIHVVAAGNSRDPDPMYGGNPTRDAVKGLANNGGRNIVVGAIGDDGEFSWYSSFGAVLMCCAPSNDCRSRNPPCPNKFGVTTTDRTGADGYNNGTTGGDYGPADGLPNPANYTSSFGGTSAAAPLVSGIIALAKEANPQINRDNIGHLIVRSCDVIDVFDVTYSSDRGWRENNAGFRFNQNYGFGKLNAAKLVSEAQKFAGLTGFGPCQSGISLEETPIPDMNVGPSIERTFSFPPGRAGKMTELIVVLSITHARRGDLICHVTSPSGFRSRLFTSDHQDEGSNIPLQRLRSMAFWGEDYEGTWTLEIGDNRAGFNGRLTALGAATYLEEYVEIDRPENDDLENAFEITSLAPVTGSNVDSTTEPYEPDIANACGYSATARKSVWWTGTATRTGFLTASTVGSDFDTVLHVYKANSDSLEDLELLDWNDDFDNSHRQSFVRTPVLAGDQIAVRVTGYSGASGNIQIEATGIGSNIAVAGETMAVRGSNFDNEIVVTEAADTTFVEIDGILQTYPGVYNVTVLGYDGNDTITSNVPGITINGMEGNDDILFFGSSTNLLIGGNGNDTIRGGNGPDEIFGGAGDDLIIGRAGNDTIHGGIDDDEIRGISGRNAIFGNAGDDEIFGGTGPDEIDAGIGNDTVYGGAGADFIRSAGGTNFIDGGVASDEIIGGNGRDTINGGPGNDRIFGLDNDDVIDGGPGSDEIIGGGGRDTITGGLGLDRLFGGPGNDTLRGAQSSDYLSGGSGNDVLDGGTGHDELYGGAGNDVLTGGSGFDALHGGTGYDTATDPGETAETGIEN